jgi:hypothetical protein
VACKPRKVGDGICVHATAAVDLWKQHPVDADILHIDPCTDDVLIQGTDRSSCFGPAVLGALCRLGVPDMLDPSGGVFTPVGDMAAKVRGAPGDARGTPTCLPATMACSDRVSSQPYCLACTQTWRVCGGRRGCTPGNCTSGKQTFPSAAAPGCSRRGWMRRCSTGCCVLPPALAWSRSPHRGPPLLPPPPP